MLRWASELPHDPSDVESRSNRRSGRANNLRDRAGQQGSSLGSPCSLSSRQAETPARGRLPLTPEAARTQPKSLLDNMDLAEYDLGNAMSLRPSFPTASLVTFELEIMLMLTGVIRRKMKLLLGPYTV
jgi:hypothetical protein